jgi:iron complex transport system substrate-binding protein
VKKEKMKKEMAVLIGIAVCTMLLTSPVLASGGYSKIYGNANEDDVLDMRDVTYIKLVIFGKKPATTLADANYDGKISMLDIGQTKLIILGKEKMLTLIDLADRTVTVPRPIERVVALMPPITRMVIGVGAKDKLVGIDINSHGDWVIGDSSAGCGPKWEKVIRELRDLPVVGSTAELNQELILSLKPDVVIAYAGKASMVDICDKFQKDTDIPVVGYKTFATCDHMFKEIEMVGTVLEKEKEVEDLVSLFKEKRDKVTEVTSQLTEGEKPRVYFMWGYRRHVFTRAVMRYDPIELAGGILVAKDCAPPTFAGSITDVSMEQIIEWNPSIILIGRSEVQPCNVGCMVRPCTVEEALSDPILQTIDAVKNQRVYYTLASFYAVGAQPPRVIIETMHAAKLFHPEKFEDLDLEKEGNELFERFYGVEGLWTEIGGNLGFI